MVLKIEKLSAEQRMPLSRSRILCLAVIFTFLAGSQSAFGNNVPGVVTGELVHKTDTSIFVKTGKTSQVEIGLTAIGSLMVLKGKRLSDGVWEASAAGSGAGLGLSVIDGPRSGVRTLKFSMLGGVLGFVLRGARNYRNQKPPILVFDSNRPGDTIELIKSLAPGSRIRVTYKNHH